LFHDGAGPCLRVFDVATLRLRHGAMLPFLLPNWLHRLVPGCP
jgi:hypothetical protein